MPTYVYEVICDDGSPGERFEVVQAMSDEPLAAHPETGQTVRRVIMPFQIAGQGSMIKADRALANDGKLEQLGFTKYEKAGDGKYQKVTGKGPDMLNR